VFDLEAHIEAFWKRTGDLALRDVAGGRFHTGSFAPVANALTGYHLPYDKEQSHLAISPKVGDMLFLLSRPLRGTK